MLRLFLRSLGGILATVALLLLALAAATYIGIDIDAKRWREPVADALSRALGREVRLEGHARLTLSLNPAIALGDVRISNPPGFNAPEFVRIGEMRLAIRLLPLLRGEVQADDFHGRNIAVHLQRSADGHGNWSLDPTPRSAPPQGPFKLARGDGYRLTLENVLIELDVGASARHIELAELALDERAEGSARLSLRGKVDERFPFTVRATGAPLSNLGAAEPWPFDFQAAVSDMALTGSGAMSGKLDRPNVRLSFNAARNNDSSQPASGTAVVSGDLALDLSGVRPRISGRLAAPELDLRASFPDARGTNAPPARTLAEAYEALSRAELDLQPLARIDADIDLQVTRWAGMAGDVRDLSARLKIDAGRLAATYAVTIAGAQFEGELVADGTSAPQRLRTHLVARDAPLDVLAALVFDLPYVMGSVGRFDVTLDARGNTTAELVRDLEARIEIEDARFTYGNFTGGKPVSMRLDAAEVSQSRGRTIAGSLRGSLRGKAFDGKLRAGTVEQILREQRTPFSFDGTSGDVRARLSGTLAEPADSSGPVIALEISAPRARALAPWLGLSSQSDAGVAFKGSFRLHRQLVSLTDASLVIGRTSLTGDVSWRSADAKTLVTANVVAAVVDPAELSAVTTPAVTTRRATILEIPILPESLDFADMDATVRVGRIQGLPLEINDAVFEGRMRGGEITPSPFSLRVQGNALSGALALDRRGAAPAASLWVAGDDFELGALLRRLRVAHDIDARIGSVRLYAEIRSRALGDVLEQSSFVANIESGTLDFRDANTRAALRIAVAAGEVRADAGAPISASLTGTLGATPVTLEARTAGLREIFEPGERLPFSITAQTAAGKLAISGSAVPQRSPDVALSLALTGERLDGLDTLLATSLPPWGPYALTGGLRFSRRGYEIDAIRLALGRSVLEGNASLDNTRAPPNLTVSLNAERIQLDDFPLADWSAFDKPEGSAEPMTLDSARQAIGEGARRVHAILSRELLGKAEGKLLVAVKRLVSGKDDLGHGRFVVTVAKGRATIAPIEIDSPAGSARGSFVYEPREHDVLVEARAELDRFNYGALARRIFPNSDLDGTISLDFRLDAAAPRLSAAVVAGSGRFDFLLLPQRLRAGPLDLWAANLLFRLLPFFNISSSEVNCALGHFDLEHGRLTSRRITIDTYQTRTEGAGTIDLGTDAVDLRFAAPRAKIPQFFSFVVPIYVSGTRERYSVSVRPLDLVGAAAKWVASPIVVPIQRLFGTSLARDGSDVCTTLAR